MIPEGQKEEQFPDELEESLPAMLCENTDLHQYVMRMTEFGKLMHGSNNGLLNFNFFGLRILQWKCWVAPGYFLSQGRAFALELGCWEGYHTSDKTCPEAMMAYHVLMTKCRQSLKLGP